MSPRNKRILIILSLVTVALVAAFYWLTSSGSKLSPSATAEGSSGDLQVTVDYSRPSVRNRLIFGTKDEGALVPNGSYWRLGANAPTAIEFNKDVRFNDSPVPAGRYRVYAIPGDSVFTIALNSSIGWSGAREPDYEKDVLRTTVPVKKAEAPVEVFTIALDPGPQGLMLRINWEKIQLEVPVSAN